MFYFILFKHLFETEIFWIKTKLTEICRIVVCGTVKTQSSQIRDDVWDTSLVYALALA